MKKRLRDLRAAYSWAACDESAKRLSGDYRPEVFHIRVGQYGGLGPFDTESAMKILIYASAQGIPEDMKLNDVLGSKWETYDFRGVSGINYARCYIDIAVVKIGRLWDLVVALGVVMMIEIIILAAMVAGVL